jgi:hypothetical protein
MQVPHSRNGNHKDQHTRKDINWSKNSIGVDWMNARSAWDASIPYVREWSTLEEVLQKNADSQRKNQWSYYVDKDLELSGCEDT